MVLSKFVALNVPALLWPVLASASKPQQNSNVDDARKPASATNAPAKHGRPCVAAVPLPFHMAVGHPEAVTGALVQHLVTTDCVLPAGAVNWLYAWWAAAAGGAGYSLRQRQGRRRRNGGAAKPDQTQQRSAVMPFAGSLAETVHLVPTGMQNVSQGNAQQAGMMPGDPRFMPASSYAPQGSWVQHGTQLLSDALVGAAAGYNAQPAASWGTPSRPDETSNEDSGSLSDTGSQLSTESPHVLWPATPESTPPQSPRRDLLPLRHCAPSEASTSSSSNKSTWASPGAETNGHTSCWAFPTSETPSSSSTWACPTPETSSNASAWACPTPDASSDASTWASPTSDKSRNISAWTCPAAENNNAWKSSKSAPMKQQPIAEARHKVARAVPATAQVQEETCLKLSSKEADAATTQLKKGSPQEQRAMLDRIIKSAWSLSLTRHGCRVVQAALEAADHADRMAMADALRGHVREALRSPHANHVLQKCIKLLPSEQLDFVLAEVAGQARKLAQHPFGCRVLERIIEHFKGWQTSALVEEVIQGDVVELCKHSFGNYVLQHIFEFGLHPHKRRLAVAMTPRARELARHWCGSHVVEKALLFCDKEERHGLRQELARNNEELSSLAHSHYGSFVVKEMGRAAKIDAHGMPTTSS